MQLNQPERVLDLFTKSLYPQFQAEHARLTEIDRWMRNDHDRPHIPPQATSEYRQLADISDTPWGEFVVSSLVQLLYVEGFRRPDGQESAGWRAWQANGMDARQIPLHHDAVGYGYGYLSIMPGVAFDGSKMPKMRAVSPRRGMGFYADVDDEWPQVFLRMDPVKFGGRGGWRVRVYDDTQEWEFHADPQGKPGGIESVRIHGVGLPPFVRYVNRIDNEGRIDGEVEPFVSLFHRIDQDTFDRLVVQRFAAWVVRTVSGMVLPDGVPDDPEAILTPEQIAALNAAKQRIAADSILVSESVDTKFGSLPASPLDGQIAAKDADLRDLSAVAQVPPHHLLGLSANLQAESLAAAETGQARKRTQRQHTLGEAHEQALNMAEWMMGATPDAGSQVVWRDMDSRSLSQVADAFGKLVDQVDVPPEGLWSRIPGVTQQDIEAWKRMRDEAAEGDSTSATDAEYIAFIDKAADALGKFVRAGVEPNVAAELVRLSLQFTGAVPVSLRVPQEDAAALEGP